MNEKETIEAAVRDARAKPQKGVSLDAAIAGRLNGQGWIVKSCTVLTWKDGSHTVAVSDDDRNFTIHVKV